MEQQYKTMFEAAISALAQIDYALGIEDDGCNDTEKTLFRIAELKGQVEIGESLARTVMMDNGNTREPLTEDEIGKLWINRIHLYDGNLTKQLLDFAREIERKHGIGA